MGDQISIAADAGGARGGDLVSLERESGTATSPEWIGRIVDAFGQPLDGKLLIQTGLYVHGSDPQVDESITYWPKLNSFFARSGFANTDDSFIEFANLMGQADPNHMPEDPVIGEKLRDYPAGSLAAAESLAHELDVRINTEALD